MEDSLGQKWKHREFALASVSDLSSPPSSASPGIARFDSDGLQIHNQSHQIPLSVDPRTVQLFKVSPVLSVCVVERSDAGKKTLYSRGVTIQFRNEEESAAFHCVVQQWKKEVNTQGAVLKMGVKLVVEWPLLDDDIVPIAHRAKAFSMFSCSIVIN
ncbi:probable histone-arginine methyltransferase 1.3 [Cajanus cajan]|uniref:probable histone-arginine methyltransferase 1.3 n=1 Tax=Cajanus cajan TaxID=3821 RepID=UPI00098DCD98|nr:probable histone-arginine methyltransferase 1.3 [Cajanus cajan]